MKIKLFLFSLVFCFFAFVSSSFALSTSSIVDMINSSTAVPASYKTAMVANVNALKFVADSRGILYIPPIDLSTKTGVTLDTNSSGYCRFNYDGTSTDAKLLKLSDDGTSISYYWGTSTVSPVEYYTNSILCSVNGSVNKGGLELFLAPTGQVPPTTGQAPQAAELRELIAAPSGNLMNHFGVTSATLLVVGIVIFSLLLLVPLIPRLVRLFL